MRTIMSYPGFKTLPQGIKKLLLASESFFFAEAQAGTEQLSLVKMPAAAAQLPRLWHKTHLPLAVFGPAWTN